MKTGDFMMHHMHGGQSGTLVQLDREDRPGQWSVRYVQMMHDGSDVIGGGSSSSWPAEEFKPVSDAKSLAACKCFAAKNLHHDLTVKASRAAQEAETWRRVVQVMHEAEKMQPETV